METMEKVETQGCPVFAAPEEEHRWLQKLVGEWTYEVEATMESGEVTRSTGTESVRSIGGLWFLAEGQGEMPGGTPATTLMTLGYDSQKGRYVGSWIGSMMTHMWAYDGELDPETCVLTLNAEGPSMTGDGTTAQYQDLIEFKSDDYRTLSSRMQDADGKWHPFMTAHYRRKR